MKMVYTDLNFDANEIRNVSIEKLATDPSGGGLYNGRIWENTTSGLIKYYDGTNIQILANQSYVQTQIQQLGMIQGSFDASPGLLPTTAALSDGDTVIRRGDYWVISVAGSIAGIQGAPELSVGDILQFTGTTPATASHWTGIQRNINDTTFGNVKEESQTISLTANTPLTVSAATLSKVSSYQLTDSTGEEIIMDVKKGTNPNQLIFTSKRTLTGVVVELLGASA